MSNVYDPGSLGIAPPPGGFQQGGWYQGRQYWGGTLSDPGAIHPSSSQHGAGQAVSPEVNLQSDVAQGNQPGAIQSYLAQQTNSASGIAPTTNITPASPAPSGLPAQSGTQSGVPTVAPQPELNLPELYQKLIDTSQIKDKQAELTEKERQYIEAKGKINDNPFLSEATRIGREAKLTKLFDERTANLRDEIATTQADIETKLNLQLKQFDINSQQAERAFSQFNTLLGMGALDNASGEDIANITRSTGISSDMIRSAIAANKKKNVKTEMIKSVADSGEVTITVVDQDGNIVKQTSLGMIGNKQGSGTGTGSKGYKAQFLEEAKTIQGKQTPNGWVGQFPLLVAKYAPFMSLKEIYRLYSESELGQTWGPPKEDPSEIKEVYNKYSASEE